MSAKVLVAGGGIGGLTAAACLLKAGFDVTVLEQAPELAEVGAGLQLSANAVRVLYDLGLADGLEEVAVKPAAYRFVMFDSGEVLQQIEMGRTYVAQHGVPYYTLHRSDFHDLLAARVRELKEDSIRLSAKVTGFSQDSDGITANLGDGQTARGDVLIGADGIKSAVRAQIVGATPVQYTGDAAWRITVPADRLPQSTTDASMTTDICVGPGRHATTYFVRRGELVNFVGSVEYPKQDDESWTVKRPWDDLRNDFEGWSDAILAIIDAADHDECYRWALNNRDPIRGWSSGRATLLGDAAHPTLPYMAQGAAMAIEDAAVLCRALQIDGDTTCALARYERNRVDRTARIVNESTANRKLFHLPDKDALRAAFAKRDIAAERSTWLFSYDPLTVELN